MKLFFDENLSPHLVAEVTNGFPKSLHVRDVGLTGATDDVLWAYARDHGLPIVSKDSDFLAPCALGAPSESDRGSCGQCLHPHDSESLACSFTADQAICGPPTERLSSDLWPQGSVNGFAYTLIWLFQVGSQAVLKADNQRPQHLAPVRRPIRPVPLAFWPPDTALSSALHLSWRLLLWVTFRRGRWNPSMRLVVKIVHGNPSGYLSRIAGSCQVVSQDRTSVGYRAPLRRQGGQRRRFSGGPAKSCRSADPTGCVAPSATSTMYTCQVQSPKNGARCPQTARAPAPKA